MLSNKRWLHSHLLIKPINARPGEQATFQLLSSNPSQGTVVALLLQWTGSTNMVDYAQVT